MPHPAKLAAAWEIVADSSSGAIDPGPPPQVHPVMRRVVANKTYDWLKTGDKMRIKPGEIVLSLALITSSLLGIISGKAFFRGFPSPISVEWIMLLGGIAIPIAAWFLRSPSRKEQTEGK